MGQLQVDANRRDDEEDEDDGRIEQHRFELVGEALLNQCHREPSGVQHHGRAVVQRRARAVQPAQQLGLRGGAQVD